MTTNVNDGFNPDKFANNAERFLSEQAKYPVIGSLAGIVKIVGGAAQAITALACGIIAGIPFAAFGKTDILKHSWTHLKHGLGNIAAGIVETIPGVGYLMWVIREEKFSHVNPHIHVELGQQDKFMPYKSLQKEESKIDAGVNANEEHKEHALLAQNYYDSQTQGKNLTPKQKFKLKKAAVRLSHEVLKAYKSITDFQEITKPKDTEFLIKVVTYGPDPQKLEIYALG